MRLLTSIMPRYLNTLCLFFLAAALAGCQSDAPTPPISHAPVATDPAVNTTVGPLRVGDRVKVVLTGTPESNLPIEQEQDIAADQTIQLNYIGKVRAAGLTPAELQEEIQTNYVPKFYKHINVTVTPPLHTFFVGGEVVKGDRFPYTGPITVMDAIKTAGGFTPFARKKAVQLTRVDGSIIIVNCIEVLKHPEKDPPVYPGDKVDVPRRFW